MSQSPDGRRSSAKQLLRYRNAWSALSRLIGKGRSFSGRERNCCFLNTGQGEKRFADVSAATGLDLIDDGRAVALVDWDFDGRIDMWVANRTAPRVRLLRNATESDHHWLAVRLVGRECNRDAIGARVELFIGGKQPRRLIKTLHAGDGYLAQSSKWIHFGLGTSATIDRLVVSWPGGDKQTLTGLAADHRYRITQGAAQAKPWSPPRGEISLAAGPVKLPPTDEGARTIIVGRVLLPELTYEDPRSRRVSLDSFRGGPLLVNLWSKTCRPCMAELSDWTKQQEVIKRAKLQVLALCVDGLDKRSTQTIAAEGLLSRMGFPYASGRATRHLVNVLEAVHRTYLEMQRTLPVPSSFLIDSQGRLAAIYKGPVATDQLIADVKSLDSHARERRDTAVPFAGRWVSQPFPSDPTPILKTLVGSEQTGAALAYAKRYLAGAPSPPNRIVAGVYRMLGDLLIARKNLNQAAAAYGHLHQYAPNDASLHQAIGEQLMLNEMAAAALTHLNVALRHRPNDPRLLYNIGLAELTLGRSDQAVGHLRSALKYQPRDYFTVFQLARALRESGQAEEARRYDAQAEKLRGQALLMQSKLQAAIEALRASLDNQSEDAETHFYLAISLHAEGRTSDALPHYRRALDLRPDWVAPANDLAWILATHQDAAIRDARSAVRWAEIACKKTDHANASMLATLAAALAEANQYDKAQTVMRKAIKLAQQAGRKPQQIKRLQQRLDRFAEGKPWRDGLSVQSSSKPVDH